MKLLTKEFTFDCAHYLAEYDGDCKNIHGHTYKVQISIKRLPNKPVLPEDNGIILDFKILKDIFDGEVKSRIDHALIIDISAYSGDCQCGCYDFLEGIPGELKTFLIRQPSTAENLVDIIHDLMVIPLDCYNCHIEKIVLWETPTSSVEAYY